MFNAPSVAKAADGVPIDSFSAAGAAAFSFMFAAWGLGQLVLGLGCLVVMLRYRSLVPLAFLAMLVEQTGRMWLRVHWPVERNASAPGATINLVFTAVIVVGFALSIWKPDRLRAGSKLEH
jgi:hypothetical protein